LDGSTHIEGRSSRPVHWPTYHSSLKTIVFSDTPDTRLCQFSRQP
jgi:hypothetical protein